MIFSIITLLVALIISSISAYFSIVGLAAIFSAAFWPIVIMGSSLELGKIVSTLWLHYYWDQAGIKLKLYLVPSVCMLMFLTSMGIFGFLSRSHSEQGLLSGDVASKVQIFDEKIKTQKDNITQARKDLQQMDAAVDQMIGRTTDDSGVQKSTTIRKNQAKERSRLQKEIEDSQKKVVTLQEERAPIAAEVRKVESDTGPIKYIAALIYGDNPDQNLLEAAVRWVIIIIVSVFDPLAIVLLLAATSSIDWAREEKKRKPEIKKSVILEEPRPLKTEEEKQEISEAAAKAVFNDRPSYFEDPKPVPVIDEEQQVEVFDAAPVLDELDPTNFSRTQPEDFVSIASYTTACLSPDNWNDSFPDIEDTIEILPVPVVDVIAPVPAETYQSPTKPLLIPAIAKNTIDSTARLTKSGFGVEFPLNPDKGDTYLRVDYLPSKLFKWNEQTWIEVYKSMSDSHVFNEQYIQYLIEQLSAGTYTPDDLSEIEQEQVSKYLTKTKE